MKAYGIQRWTEILPTVLSGLRSVIKEDANASPAEMVYGQALRLPNEFFNTSDSDIEPGASVQKLKEKIELMKPMPSSRHVQQKVFVAPELNHCTHVFVRREAVKKSLQPSFDGLYRVVKNMISTIGRS